MFPLSHSTNHSFLSFNMFKLKLSSSINVFSMLIVEVSDALIIFLFAFLFNNSFFSFFIKFLSFQSIFALVYQIFCMKFAQKLLKISFFWAISHFCNMIKCIRLNQKVVGRRSKIYQNYEDWAKTELYNRLSYSIDSITMWSMICLDFNGERLKSGIDGESIFSESL